MNLIRIPYIRKFFVKNKELHNSIKNIFGYSAGNIFLYELAFRHKSAAPTAFNGNKLSNERLEYLGDAILSAVVADFLFRKFPFKEEGFLTEMRSKIVSRAQLNKLSQRLGIGKLIKSNPETRIQCKSMMGDAFEAFIGALYLDKGYTFTKRIIITRIISIHFDLEKLEKEDINFKSKLIEWGQKEKKKIEFKVIKEVGEGYNKQYVIQIFIDDKPYGISQDYSIKGADQLASEKTLNLLIEQDKLKQQ
ncbi:MAG: ribonuclease III [Hyphomicrobiales bacterium]